MNFCFWGCEDAEYEMLGTGPAAKIREIGYPFDLPGISEEPLIMSVPYFCIIYENLGAVFGYDCSVEHTAFTEYA